MNPPLNSRRSFFGMLFAPLVARFVPVPKAPVKFEPKFYSVEIAADPLAEMSAITRKYIDQNRSILCDVLFAPSPFSNLITKQNRIIESGGRILGHFGKMPGQSWERLSGGLQHPSKPPRLPQ